MKQTVLISLFLAGSAMAMPPASHSRTVRGQDDATTPESIYSLNWNNAANIYARQAANGFKQASTIQDCRDQFIVDLGNGWRPCVDKLKKAAGESSSKQQGLDNTGQPDLSPCKTHLIADAQDEAACIAGVLGQPGLDFISDVCQHEAEQQAMDCAKQHFNAQDRSSALTDCLGKVEPSYRECAKNQSKAAKPTCS